MTAAIALAALAVYAFALPESTPVADVPFWLPWWALACVFLVTELYGVNVPLRRQAHGIALNELPLVVGLFVLTPQALLAAAVVGQAAGMLLHRMPPVKLAFNLSQLALTTGLAIVAFGLVAGDADPRSAVAWAAAFAATAVFAAAGALLVGAVLSLADRRLPLAAFARTACSQLAGAVAVTSVSLLVLFLAVKDVRALALLLVPAAVTLLAYRAYIGEHDRRARVEFLYESIRSLQRAPTGGADVDSLLTSLRSTFHARTAELLELRSGAAGEVRRSASREPGPAEVPGSTRLSPGERELLRALTESGALVAGRNSSTPAAGYLSERGHADLIAAPLEGEHGAFGLLVVAGRAAGARTFSADDLRLLETLAGHVSVSLENGQLERSLADATELKEQLRHAANHDPLTGLANRRLFAQRARETVGDRRAGGAAVLFLDFDDFKRVNDQFGHSVGDEVLALAAQRLGECVRAGDLAARVGGDEFAVLLAAPCDEASADALARRVAAAFAEPIRVGSRRIAARVSVGVSTAAATASPDELLHRADSAMYLAKRRAKPRAEAVREAA